MVRLDYSEEEHLLNQVVAQAELKCERCGSNGRLEISGNKHTIRCTKRLCYQGRSLWRGTALEDIKIPRVQALGILDLWMKCAPTTLICDLVGIERKAVHRLLKKVSRIAVPRYYEHVRQIGGPDVTVEVDESKFGRRKFNRGHRVDGTWVLGAVEKTGKRRIMIIPIENRTRETLLGLLSKYVHPESRMRSDMWRGYIGAAELFAAHETVNHSLHFKDPETGVHTNTIEGNWAAVKAQTPVRSRTRSLVWLYLLRFMLRREFRKTFTAELIKLILW
ncbi:hypothetical protein PAPHI01_2493 [Pancytospora philotis]|nr:hypothetical protein PAPHI01_2493 [Pancytospora philotis]